MLQVAWMLHANWGRNKKKLKTWSIDNSRSLYWARKNGLYCKWFVRRSVFLSSQQEQEKIHKTTCKSFLRAQNLNVLDSRIACFFMNVLMLRTCIWHFKLTWLSKSNSIKIKYIFFSYSIQAWIYIASGQHYGGCRTTSTVHMCRQTSRGTQGDNDKKKESSERPTLCTAPSALIKLRSPGYDQTRRQFWPSTRTWSRTTREWA